MKYPGAGGLYLWTRNDFGPLARLPLLLVYWMGIAFWFPSAAMFYMSAGVYALGPSYAHLADSRVFLLAHLAGRHLDRARHQPGRHEDRQVDREPRRRLPPGCWARCWWSSRACSWRRRGSATPINIAPTWNWDTISFWSNIAYAMSGLEMAGLMGGEIRDPERTLPRAGWIASGFTTVFYALATIALLVILRPEKISEMNGLAEAGESAARSSGPRLAVAR